MTHTLNGRLANQASEAGLLESGHRTQCLLPPEVADTLFGRFKRHFAADPQVEVLRERRRGERRTGAERRTTSEIGPPEGRERRRIANDSGRRIADRRVETSEIAPPELPRKLRSRSSDVRFVDRAPRKPDHVEEIDTARLIVAYQSGRRAAFDRIYARYFERAYAHFRLIVRDRHEAEDLTQQLFLDLVTELRHYQPRRSFRAWLFTIVRNRGISHLRKQRRLEPESPEMVGRRQSMAEDRDNGLSALSWISDQDLMVLLERLPLAQRQVIFLRFVAGMDSGEVAQILGRSDDAVKGLQKRALAFLRTRLKALGREPHMERRAKSRRPARKGYVLHARRFALLWRGPVR